VSDYAYEHMVRVASGWEKPYWYHEGDRVTWKGHLLRCDVDHYAGGDADDPWDPGHGWDVRKRSRLWTVIVPQERSA
jgi:hypothetical protein